MRYPCLVLDHDDTVVNSTAVIHYPSFVEYLKRVRPGAHYTLEEYFRLNFDPGIIPLFTQVLGFSDEELEGEFDFWKEYVKTRVPDVFPGMREILWRFHEKGGIITVVSHSVSENILRDYHENGLPQPDAIFGWELPPEQRKPHPYPLEQIMRQFSLESGQLLMLDDLKPGFDMAQLCGVDFAAAGWANDIPQIEQFMRRYGKYYFKTVDAFGAFMEECYEEG